MPRPADPIEQLLRAHRRIEEACDALAVATVDRDLATVADVCSFFERQVRRHEEDEERSLFPRLGGDAVALVVDRLSREHREHEALHSRLERLSAASEPAWAELSSVADEMARRYRAHIDVEEQQLFPAVRKLLPTETLDEILREMDQRRGR
jgi:hemerythrin-like domain-containing protein